MALTKGVFGFSDGSALARSAAHALGCPAETVKTSHYAAGELAIHPPKMATRHAILAASVDEEPASLVRALFLVHALRDAGARRVDLFAPWIAYGRQDRTTHDSTGAGTAIAFHLSHGFDRIVTFDAHSSRFETAFRGHLLNVRPDYGHVFSPAIRAAFNLVVAPDEGASDRAKRTARALGIPFIVLKKQRSARGVRTGFCRASDRRLVNQTHALIVDDMADSGGTLEHAAAALRLAGASSVRVSVTHAFDLSKLRAYLRPCCEDVRTIFDHASGRIDQCHLELAAKLLR